MRLFLKSININKFINEKDPPIINKEYCLIYYSHNANTNQNGDICLNIIIDLLIMDPYDYDDLEYYDFGDEQSSESKPKQQIEMEYCVNDEGNAQELIQSQLIVPSKENKKIRSVDEFNDPAFDLLLDEQNWFQIEKVIYSSDFDSYFFRVGKLFNYILNILNFTSGEDICTDMFNFHYSLVIQEQVQDFHEACRILVETLYFGQHSDFAVAEFDGVILIKSEKMTLRILIHIMTLSSKNFTSQQAILRQQLPRLLINLIQPPVPFQSALSSRDTKSFILSYMEESFLQNENQYFEASQIEIITLVFLVDFDKNITRLESIVNLLSAFLESFLECEDISTQNEVQVSMINILHLFILLTNKQAINELFYNNQLHWTLYKYIKFSQPIFSLSSISKVWIKEPLICQGMVTLICRITSANRIDQKLAQTLLDDFLFLINRQQFEFIYSTILPILNTENLTYIPICLHSMHSTKSVEKSQQLMREYFRKNQQQRTMNLKLRLQSELLSFEQRDNFSEIFYKYINFVQEKEKPKVMVQKKKPQQLKAKSKKIQILEEEQEKIDLMDFFQVFGDEEEGEKLEQNEQQQLKQQVLQKLQQVEQQQQEQQLGQEQSEQSQMPQQLEQQQEQQQKVQQTPQPMSVSTPDAQMEKMEQVEQPGMSQSKKIEEENKHSILGSWIQLHSFSHQNPIFTYAQTSEILKDKSNVLLIFDLISNFNSLKLCVFVEGPIGLGSSQIGFSQSAPSQLHGQKANQAKATLKSFYSFITDTGSIFHFQALEKGENPFIMLDLQYSGLNLVYKNELVAYINFGNIQMSKFGFPFGKLKEKTLEVEKYEKGLKSEETFLLGAEIWEFNARSNTVVSEYQLESQLSRLAQKKTFQEIINQFSSQLRLENLHFVPSSATIENIYAYLESQLGEKVQVGLVPFSSKGVDQGMRVEKVPGRHENVVDLYVLSERFNSNLIACIPDSIVQNRPKALLSYFQKELNGMSQIAQTLNKIASKFEIDYILEFFFDLQQLIEVHGYLQHLLEIDGFLQQMIGIVFLSQEHHLTSIVDAFHKGIMKLYLAFKNLLRTADDNLKYSLFYNFYFKFIVQRIYSYIGTLKDETLNQDPKDDNQLKELFAGQKAGHQAKGKPKGIGYGDISYNSNKFKTAQAQQQAKPKQEKVTSQKMFGSLGSSFKNDVLAILFDCLHSMLHNLPIDRGIQEMVQNSMILPILKTLFSNQSISEMQNPMYVAALNFIQLLAQYEEFYHLFVKVANQDLTQIQNDVKRQEAESKTLFRILEALAEQARFYQTSFKEGSEKNSVVNLLLETFETVQNQLVAGEYIKVEFKKKEIEQEEAKNQDPKDDQLNMHQFYRVFMKPMAVGKSNIKDDSVYLAKMGQNLKGTSANPPASKMNRLIQEIADLGNSLPIEATNSIFVRYDESRMDVMRFMIFGAAGTPYAHGGFLYEAMFMDDYPQRPPKVLLSTTGNGKFRFNPNLYACGKVCLSLLGTWGDNWIANVSTILQILISILSMVMSEYVMFNEPGWECQMNTPDGEKKNLGYCNVVRIANIRYAMLDQLRNPPQGFQDVVKKSFFLRKDLIKKEIEQWIQDAEKPALYTQTQNSNPYQQNPGQYKTDLVKVYEELCVELEKLKLNIGNDFCLASDKDMQRSVRILKNSPIDFVKDQCLKKYKSPALALPESQVDESIDVSYSQNVVQKAFDASSQDVQNLMSRYIGVLGVDAVQKQSEATVLLVGVNSLGIEVAKNIVLSGVKKLTIWDDSIATEFNRCGQFYLWESDLGQKKSQASIQKLKHLNPYVQIDQLEGQDIAPYCGQYHVVVICDCSWVQMLDVVKTCRRAGVKTILAQTYGFFGRIITDFGDEFQVFDKDGENPVDVQIESIEGKVVTLFKNQKHTLQDGDTVVFQEVVEQDDPEKASLNNQQFTISNVRRHQFEIDEPVAERFRKYVRNGMVYQQRRQTSLQFAPLEQALNLDCSEVYAESMSLLFEEQHLVRRDVIHLLFNYLHEFGELPSWNLDKAAEFVQYVLEKRLQDKLKMKYNNQDVLAKYLKELYPTLLLFVFTSQGVLPPLNAFFGGLVCQEVLKAITHKYTPIKQTFIHSADEIATFPLEYLANTITLDLATNQLRSNPQQFNIFVTQYHFSAEDPLTILLGSQLLSQIKESKIFMIGAGAIGCELLKNYAMCHFCTSGKLYLTDPDFIEHSNLNRQFLFREKHIRKPKSLTAAAVAKQMNPDIQIVARLDKVCPESADIYHPNFFQHLDCVTNALDNVQARLYIDQRCIESSRPLIESGTLGPKGHVQVILPNLTETYGSKQDPQEDNDIPYCTLKMFPEETLHCLEWARDKFETMFFTKPQSYKSVIENLMNYQTLQISQLEIALKILKRKPKNFIDCLKFARNKYQKFFHNAILQLLEAYPLDHKDEKGKLFWSTPKRPPQVNEFQANDEMKLQFVLSTAILQSQIHGVPLDQNLIQDKEQLIQALNNVEVAQFKIDKSKLEQIQKQVQEKQGQEQMEQEESSKNVLQQKSSGELVLQIAQNLSEYFNFSGDPENLEIKCKKPIDNKIMIQPIQFEKDEDDNHHINFIQAATNCRAHNYKLEHMNWLQVKLKAGRIVPAMATTTACISALQTIELIKVISKQQKLEKYQNSFINLAIPAMMQSEPGTCDNFKLENLEFNLWKKIEFQMNQVTISLRSFLKRIEKILGNKVMSLKQGANPVYVEQMLSKNEEEKEEFLNGQLLRLVNWKPNTSYVDLDTTIMQKDKEINGPRVRLYF